MLPIARDRATCSYRSRQAAVAFEAFNGWSGLPDKVMYALRTFFCCGAGSTPFDKVGTP